ncbi:MAG: TetR/AcrR family transcriptional regulator [Bacteroidota bacterium]
MSPKTEDQFKSIREEKRKLILDTALTLFANHGYHSTSISNIAKQAGISKGLMYNYFGGKEELLKTIFLNIMAEIMGMLNPDHDDEITDDEAEGFFDKFFEVLINNPDQWRLYYQLSIQPDVMQMLMQENINQQFQESQKIMIDYFVRRDFVDPELAILIFSSLFKGFTFIYAFAPEMFSKELLEKFKQSLKDMFLKKISKEKNEAPTEFDERLGYFLL